MQPEHICDSYDVADIKLDIYNDNVPMASCIVQFVQKQMLNRPMVILFDSGSTTTWISAKAMPKGAVPTVGDATTSSTLAGEMNSNLTVKLERIVFPEFFKTRIIDSVDAKVFHADCRFDAIIGRDMLSELGLVLDFKNNKMSWDDCHVPMRLFPSPNIQKPGAVKEPTFGEQLFWDAMEADLDDDDTLPTCDLTDDEGDDDSINDEFINSDIGNDHAYNASQEDYDDEPRPKHKKINESKYESADIDEVVRSCTHLNMVQQNDLHSVLEKYPILFNNELRSLSR